MAGGVFQPDRVARTDRIQLRGRGIAALGQLALVPAGTLHPFPRPGGGGASAHGGQQVRQAADAGQVHMEQGVLAGFQHMGMGVDQARRRRTAAQVDDPGLTPHQGRDLGVRAETDDPSVAHRQGLDEVTAGIEGLDPSVQQDEVRGLPRVVENGEQGQRPARARRCRSQQQRPRAGQTRKSAAAPTPHHSCLRLRQGQGWARRAAASRDQ